MKFNVRFACQDAESPHPFGREVLHFATKKNNQILTINKTFKTYVAF